MAHRTLPLPAGPPRRPGLIATALLALCVVALAARAIGYERVFLDDGSVVFAIGDAFYHARRALFSFLHFPQILFFDPCINHPDGSVVPHPPLLDWAVAGLARATGSSRAHFEVFAAWSPACLGAASLVPVCVLGWTLRGAGVGLGAAAIYALLPITITYSRVGNVDHHAAQGLLGATLLALYALALDPRTRGRRLALVFAGLCLARAALLLVWTGSLLYLAPGEIAIVLGSAALRRRDLLGAQAWSCLATAALVAPAILLAPVPNGGPWSATELSRLHLAALAAAAAVAGGALGLETLRPSGSATTAVARALGFALAVGLALLLVPGLRDGIRPAFSFLAKTDRYTSRVVEQLPLFYEQGRHSLAAGERRMGWFVYLVPFVPLAFVAGANQAGRGPRALFLVAWSVLFGALALQQFRYANDYAPAGCVGFALLLARGGDWLRSRGASVRAAHGAALLAGVVLWSPSVPRHFVPSAQPMAWHWRGQLAGVDRALLSIEGTQVRFAQQLAELTPGLACDASARPPAQGILAHPAIGHVLHHVAERATPADPFGPYIGKQNYLAVLRFFESESEAEALAIAERLRTPFVLSAEEGGEQPGRIVQRLHREDGSARGALAHLERFRLITEGPKGGLPMSVAFEEGLRGTAPYKLWAVVPGALLEGPAAPGEEVWARLALESPTGRRFVFHARATGDAEGVARLRVPYPTQSSQPTRALGPYRVRSVSGTWRVRVPEQAVLAGEVIRVERSSG